MEPQKSPLEERLDRIDQRFDKLEKMLLINRKGKMVWRSEQDREH